MSDEKKEPWLNYLALATVVAAADDRPKAQHAASAAEAQAKTEAVQGRTEHAQAETEAVQGQTEEAQAPTEEGAKLISVPGGKALGMSILGNQEAPKSLVIVPWKSSEIGRDTDFKSSLLSQEIAPIDKPSFLRGLDFYKLSNRN